MADDFDLDDLAFDVELSGDHPAHDDPGPTAHRAGTRLLVIDPNRAESPLVKQLEAIGYGCSQVETGGQAMQAIGAGQFAALICASSGDDDDWRRFLGAGVRQRFEGFPLIFTARTPTDSERERLLEQGASAVLPAPLPPPAELGAMIDSLLGIEAGELPAADAAGEMALLQRRLRDAEEAGRLKDKEIEELKSQFMTAIDEAAQRTTESTGLRSEVSMLRDRASLMKDRLSRAMTEVQWLKEENARLAVASGEEPAEAPPPSAAAQQRLEEMKSLLAALLPFDQALAQAVDFLEDLAVIAGPRAPALQKHVRQLGLLRDVFGRIRARLGERSAAPPPS